MAERFGRPAGRSRLATWSCRISGSPSLFPWAALVGLLALAYLPLLFGQVLFQRDVGRWIFPARKFLADALAKGDSPLWNPLQGLGQSTLANPLNELFYPLAAPLLLGFSARLTSWFLFLHLMLGAVGMVLLGIRLARLSPSAALVTGLAWALSGYATSAFTAGLLLVSSAYLPWFALGFLHLSRTIAGGDSARVWFGSVAWAAVPVALCCLTGEVFFPAIAAAFAVSVATGDVLAQSDSPPRLRLRAWAGRLAIAVCCAMALGTAVAAVALIPAKQAAAATARMVALPRAVAEVGSFHPWRLVEMIAPGAMGDPYTDYVAGPWIGELSGRPLLYGCYLGSSVLFLALLAFGRRKRLATVLGGTAVLSLLIAMGRHTPLHGWVRAIVPLLGLMRGPEKYLAVFFACTSLLAGLGCARLLDDRRGLHLRALAVVGVLLVLLAGVPGFPAIVATQIRASALVGLAFVITLVGVIWFRVRSPRLAATMLTVVVFADLTRAVAGLQNFATPELLEGQSAAATAVLADASKRGIAPPRSYRSSDVDTAIEAASPPTSIVRVQKNLVRTLIDNHTVAAGIASVPGYDAALPSSLAALWSAGQPAGLDLLRVTGVEYAVFPKANRPNQLTPLLEPAPGTQLVRLSNVLPRVYVATASAMLADRDATRAVFAADVVSGRHVILATTPVVPATVEIAQETGHAGLGPRGGCTLTSFANTRISAECETESPALAVFVEQYDRGWNATVDGKPAQVLRANLALRAVPIAAGRHSVVLSFSPAGLRSGVIVSLIASVLLCAMLWPPRRRPQRTPGLSRGTRDSLR